ncbi:MAG: methyltransferase domain-containing protein [Planctomycetota bacterium]|nr:methyltransferase domain-containing protein [Planctomycetota bacterium]
MPNTTPSTTTDPAAQGNTPAATREYVLGTNPAELQRLGFQHRLWSRDAHRLWARAVIRPGHRVLDVGSGPGFASLDLAQIVGPTGSVLGIDESEPFIAFANDQARARHLDHARFAVADAAQLDALGDLEPGTYDFAYCRWLLCFVSDPKAVIAAITRALKPGGKLLVQDYFRYDSMCVAPRSAPFETVIAAVAKSWRDHGGDPDIMGTLPEIAIEQGLKIEHLDRLDPGPARPGTLMWHWPDTFWGVFLPRLAELGYITKDQHADFLTAWKELSANPAAFMHLPPMYELIATK